MTPHLSTMMPSGHQSRNLGVGKVSRSALSRWLYWPRNSEPGPKRHSWLFM